MRRLRDTGVGSGNRVFHSIADLAGDVRYALRTWRRQPVFAAIAVISLAAGIGLNTAVFSIINTIFFQTVRGVPQPDRVVDVGGRVSFTTFRAVRDNSQSLASVAAWQPIGADLRFRGLTLRRVIPAVSEGYFTMLGVQPVRGRFFASRPAQRPDPTPEAVLDHEFWTEMMAGDPAVIGEVILVNGVQATIVGIAPQAFHGFGPQRPPLWIPMGLTPAVKGIKPRWEEASENGWRIVGRLRDGTAAGQVDAELSTLAAHSPALFPDGPLRSSTGRERLTGPVSPEKQIEFLLVVTAPLVVVGLILWIGCSNVANLLLARAVTRRKEIAIRLASGASRFRLMRLLLTESLILAGAGGAFGMILSAWTLEFVWKTLPELPPLAVEMDGRVLLYTAFTCIVATVFFGIAPAIHATGLDVAPLLKGEEPGQTQAKRGARARMFFLVTQFASSAALLIVAGTFVRTLVSTHVGEQSAQIEHLALGYIESKDDSAAARLEYWRGVREEIARVPTVVSATLMQSNGNKQFPLVPEGSAPGFVHATATLVPIDSSYFRTLGTTLVAGRDDVGDQLRGSTVSTSMVVNERAARQFWNTDDVVGRQFAFGGVDRLVVTGVIRDDGAEARVYRPLSDGDLQNANVLIRTSQPSINAVEPLRAVFVRLSRDRAFTRVSTLREATTGGLQRLTRMAVAIAALVLALATVGLYGSVSFVTSQRTREIAIRMAVGAPRPAVLRLLAREGVLVVAGGSAVGAALIAIAFRFMSGMIFSTWTLDPITLLGVLTVFAAATFAACYLPGRRAMRIDPMSVLRSE